MHGKEIQNLCGISIKADAGNYRCRTKSCPPSFSTLEDYLGDNLLIVTQNVDDLHSRAGSKNLIHMHGELRILRCEECHETFDMMKEEHLTSQYVPCPSCSNQRLRPTLYGFMKCRFNYRKFMLLLRNVSFHDNRNQWLTSIRLLAN